MKELEQKFSSDLEIPKYLKRKENDISKANKKSKHKHQYEECLIRYKWNWDEHKIHTSLNSYCTICGKIGDTLKNGECNKELNIIREQRQKDKLYYVHIPDEEVYERLHNRLPVFFVKDICNKYVDLKQNDTSERE